MGHHLGSKMIPSENENLSLLALCKKTQKNHPPKKAKENPTKVSHFPKVFSIVKRTTLSMLDSQEINPSKSNMNNSLS